jgi:hypothetical protein
MKLASNPIDGNRVVNIGGATTKSVQKMVTEFLAKLNYTGRVKRDWGGVMDDKQFWLVLYRSYLAFGTGSSNTASIVANEVIDEHPIDWAVKNNSIVENFWQIDKEIFDRNKGKAMTRDRIHEGIWKKQE